MAKVQGVWGIDVGQCALKALRCRRHDSDPTMIVAESFDYVEYPKILSQPDADADQLVADALEQFMSRNDLAGDQVAISVSGQSGLARFIKLPPVESKKIPDIVKYEARQQIPFALEDVVWDYQQMAGGSEDDGFSLETEVGLFAMKRDQVFRALKPFDERGIPVDLIQLSPLAIFNYVVFDQFPDLPPVDEYDPEDPPHSTVVLSIGTDNTDLVVTNGFRVWQRSIPIGGNHFTKALTKELRLTFSKAEHLKRHAKEAENAKAVFQAMRPVFSDLLSEIQRSLGFFAGLDQHARISRMIALGNAMKLPGLRRYLSQNLEHEVQPIPEFRGLDGPSIVDDPQFKSNQLTFGTCYGLCLQGLGSASIKTNLLPQEIVTERLVRAKKPWVVGAVAALLLGCTISFAGHWSAWRSAEAGRFEDAFREVGRAESQSNGFKTQFSDAEAEKKRVIAIGQNLVSNVEGRLRWLELYKAIDAALPRDAAPPADDGAAPAGEDAAPPAAEPIPIGERNELHIESIVCEEFDDIASWYAANEQRYLEDHNIAKDAGGEDGAADSTMGLEGVDSRSSWVIQMKGYHFHNEDPSNQGADFVRNTLLKQLKDGSVRLGGESEQPVPMEDLSIRYPVLVESSPIVPYSEPDRAKLAESRNKPQRESFDDERGGTRRSLVAPSIELKRFDFVVQFCWQPTTKAERKQLAEDRRVKMEAAKLAAVDDGNDNPTEE